MSRVTEGRMEEGEQGGSSARSDGELVRRLYGHPNEKLQRKRLEDTMRNRTVIIERRVSPEPPTDVDDDEPLAA
jgi:hypothetical protein